MDLPGAAGAVQRSREAAAHEAAVVELGACGHAPRLTGKLPGSVPHKMSTALSALMATAPSCAARGTNPRACGRDTLPVLRGCPARHGGPSHKDPDTNRT